MSRPPLVLFIDERSESGVYLDQDSLTPLLVGGFRCVVGDEVVCVLLSIEREQPGGCQSMANLGAVSGVWG